MRRLQRGRATRRVLPTKRVRVPAEHGSQLRVSFPELPQNPMPGKRQKETFNDHVVTLEEYGSEDVNHSLTGLSVPTEHARYFGHQLAAGPEGAVVTVHAPGREDEAIDLLQNNGADIGDDAEGFDYGAASEPKEAKNIKLYGEVLRVHKDRVSGGEVRVRKEVISTNQVVEIPVTREELVVERVPVSGQKVATGATFAADEIGFPSAKNALTWISRQSCARKYELARSKSRTLRHSTRKSEVKN